MPCCAVLCHAAMSTDLSCHLVVLVVLQAVVLQYHIHRHPLTAGAPVGKGEGRGGEGWRKRGEGRGRSGGRGERGGEGRGEEEGRGGEGRGEEEGRGGEGRGGEGRGGNADTGIQT